MTKEQPPASETEGWTSIDDTLPPLNVLVQCKCWMDDCFTDVESCRWNGKWTLGNAVVMDVTNDPFDWVPCSHWRELS